MIAYNVAMKFSELLNIYRERRGLTKTDLANRVNLSLGYLQHIESGRRNPPPQDTCQKIAEILGLSPKERAEFLRVAVEERVPSKIQAEALNLSIDVVQPKVVIREDQKKSPPWMIKLEKIIENNPSVLTALQDQDVLDALSDPVVLGCLKNVQSNKQNLKEALATLIERFPKMAPEKRTAILALCQ